METRDVKDRYRRFIEWKQQPHQVAPLSEQQHECPDLRLSECFVAMVYITNMLLIYDMVPLLLCFSATNEIIYGLLSLLLIIIPVRQLTGYSYPSTIWRLIVAFIPFAILVILVYFVALFGIAAYMHLNAS